MSDGFEIRINKHTVSAAMEQTFLGAGMGGLFSQAVSYIGPACRMATPAGMMFGAVFSLARLVDAFVLAAALPIAQKLGNYVHPLSAVSFFMLAGVGSYAIRGAVAFGATLFLGITPIGAVALTGTFLAVDVLSAHLFDHAWTSDAINALMEGDIE